jgi:hypothetical protein
MARRQPNLDRPASTPRAQQSKGYERHSKRATEDEGT